MKFRLIATFAALACVSFTAHAEDAAGCATLAGRPVADAGASMTSGMPRGFTVRDGEPVDYVSGAKTVHGKLLVFGDNGVYRAYWQPENSAEKYVMANAGANAVRFVSTPTQGSPVKNGQPGITLAPQTVLSCPTF